MLKAHTLFFKVGLQGVVVPVVFCEELENTHMVDSCTQIRWIEKTEKIINFLI